MNEPVFLDTSGRIALLHTRDPHHAIASHIWRTLGEQGVPVIVTDWVVAETGNGLARTPARLPFVNTFRMLKASSNFRVIIVDDDLMDQALEMYETRRDKAWGLVDCASFVVMGGLKIQRAFTTDRHFAQAGFDRLIPRSEDRNGV